MYFVVRTNDYGFKQGDRIDLWSWTIEGAIAELLYCGLYVGKDGLLVADKNRTESLPVITASPRLS